MAHSLTYRRMLTRMGYYNYQNGLIYRHLNQDDGWQGHLGNCRRFILKAIDLYNPAKITVLGSGWLLDLPFTEIIERGIKICLIDIIHPPDVINQVIGIRNAELMEQDITGGLIDEVWQMRRKLVIIKRYQSLNSVIVPEFRLNDDPGMVISLNILTQLESMPLDFLRKRSNLREEEVNVLRKKLQQQHIDLLKKYQSVLITDYAELIKSRAGDTKTITTLIADLPPGSYREDWIWKFDQTGADLYNCRSQFKVLAQIN
jgi:hypothetical protein